MAKNDITQDEIKSRPNSKAYSDNYDRIFGVLESRMDEVLEKHDLLEEEVPNILKEQAC